MKKIYLLTLLVTIFSFTVNAQHYGFTQSQQAYVAFDDGIVISPEEWDDDGFLVDMPFSFQVFGEEVTSVILADVVTRFRDENENTVGDFLGFSADLISRGSFASPISAKVEGDAPNQILKVQYKNAGFAFDGSFLDYANFQLWIYEGTNVLEVRFGDCDVKSSDSWDGETGPRIEIVREDFSAGISLKGNTKMPTVVLDKDLLNELEILTGAPDSGTVYTFTPRKHALAVDLVSEDISINLYPNPLKNTLIIELDNEANADLLIVNSVGEEVMNRQALDGRVEINTSDLTPGVYFVKIISGTTIVTRKVLKAE